MLARKAMLIYVDNGYGQPLASRFRSVAAHLNIDAHILPFATATERDAAVQAAIDDPEQPPLMLGMTTPDASPLLIKLRRADYRGLIFGTTTMARAAFPAEFAQQPEEQQQFGYFTEGVYATSPIIPDSANAATLAYAALFEAKFGREPSWESIQADDEATLAMAAIRAAFAKGPTDAASARKAILSYLKELNDPSRALAGLAGPIWFTPDRVRPSAVRIGRFHDGIFASAPTQIVPVTIPEPKAIASGAIFDLGEGDYGRLQSVVYTGIYVNEVSRVDLAQSNFDADFYVWERFARLSVPDAADPTKLVFPNMLSGSFDRENPTEQGQMPDGTEYRLWQVRGTFRNDFDLHRFPFDRQQVSVSLFNALAATDRIVYVLDRRSVEQLLGTDRAARSGRWPKIASATAFHNLTQWVATEAQERREDLVTSSRLGDLRRVGAERNRELSGFVVTVSLQRRAMSTLVKSLLPLMLMTVIMFASLKFPHALVKEKITVAVTAALSGAVLLTAINAQLGGVGYTIAVEYAFYVFFGLSVLCIVSVLFAERLHTAHRAQVAIRVERSTEVVFLVAVGLTVAGAASIATLPN
jgi:branched-chain amino acid transport system substrate-binding protein